MIDNNPPAEIAELLHDYKVVVPISVAWGEMDAFQHLNNVTYFRYFESARIAFFESMGLTRDGALTEVGPILAFTSCRFLAPMTYPDTAYVGACVVKIEDDRFTMGLIIVSEKLRKVTAVGEAVLVSYDYQKKVKVGIPEVWRQKMFADLPPGA